MRDRGLGSLGDSHFFAIPRRRWMALTVASYRGIGPPRSNHVTLPVVTVPGWRASKTSGPVAGGRT